MQRHPRRPRRPRRVLPRRTFPDCPACGRKVMPSRSDYLPVDVDGTQVLVVCCEECAPFPVAPDDCDCDACRAVREHDERMARDVERADWIASEYPGLLDRVTDPRWNVEGGAFFGG